MMRQINTRNIGWFALSIICYWVLSYGGFFKYIFILLIALLGLGIKKFCVPQKYFVVLTTAVCYFLIGFICAVLNLNITKFSFKVSCFIFIPALAAICIFNAIQIKNIGIILDIQYFAIVIISIIVGSTSLKQGRLFESQYAYILGAYAIYYYALKRKRLFFSAILFTFLANKRIVLAAVAVSILLYTVIIFIKNRQIRRWINNCVVIGTLIACYMWIAFVKSGAVVTLFSTLNIESNGRINIWNNISDYYEFGTFYVGKGMGFVVNFLNELQIPGFANLHNDLLLLFIETGFWGFGLCVLSYFYMISRGVKKSKKFSSRNVLLISLIIYSFMNYLTDNILIYINYWLPGYLMFLGIMFAPVGCKEDGIDVNS